MYFCWQPYCDVSVDLLSVTSFVVLQRSGGTGQCGWEGPNPFLRFTRRRAGRGVVRRTGGLFLLCPDQEVSSECFYWTSVPQEDLWQSPLGYHHYVVCKPACRILYVHDTFVQVVCTWQVMLCGFCTAFNGNSISGPAWSWSNQLSC